MSGDRLDPFDSVEARIDAALRSYAEPPGSDPRTAAAAILQRARHLPTRRPLWLWAIPAAACLTLALVFAWLYPSPPSPGVARTVPAPEAAALSRSPIPAPKFHRPPLRAIHPAAPRVRMLPKLDVFPTPAPLSSQEQALLTFVRQAPPAAQRAVIEDQQHWDHPAATAGFSVNPPEISGIPNTDFEEPEKENR